MKFKVIGQQKDTGARMVLTIDAESKAHAQRKAAQTGMMVTRVEESDGVEEIDVVSTSTEYSSTGVSQARQAVNKGVKHGYLYRRFGSPLDFVLGPIVRTLLGLIVLGCFAMWAWSNQAAVTEEFKAMQGHSVDPTEIAAGDASRAKVQVADQDRKDVQAQDLKIKQAPKQTTLLGSWNAAGAGILLLLSALFRGKMLAIAVLLGAFVAIFGTLFTDAVGHWPMLGIGAGVGLLGIFFFREK